MLICKKGGNMISKVIKIEKVFNFIIRKISTLCIFNKFLICILYFYMAKCKF